ncbi:MAG TPA: class I SAM-dependent methyltransferase, partial [Candidatus Bilamarchaeum sp.]|nr:class I SAM-dependent methyltransferase [Candidatus Bilamarchaeum sp.]
VALTAIDIDDEEIGRAKKLFRKPENGAWKPEILQADATKLPFRDGAFDCVVEMNAFHHISEYKKAIAECQRILKKGGRFYMLDISRYFLWPLLLLVPFEHFDGKFTRDSMLKELEAAGFRIAKKSGWDVFMIEAIKE